MQRRESKFRGRVDGRGGGGRSERVTFSQQHRNIESCSDIDQNDLFYSLEASIAQDGTKIGEGELDATLCDMP